MHPLTPATASVPATRPVQCRVSRETGDGVWETGRVDYLLYQEVTVKATLAMVVIVLKTIYESNAFALTPEFANSLA